MAVDPSIQDITNTKREMPSIESLLASFGGGNQATRVANRSAFEDAVRTNAIASDPTITPARNAATDALKELFAYDQQAASRYGDPNSSMFIEDPYARFKVTSASRADIGSRFANSLNILDERKTALGNVIDKALKLYDLGTKAAQDDFSNSLELLKQSEVQRHNLELEKQYGVGNTSTERQTSNLKNLATDDVKKGLTLSDLVKTYGGDLTLPDLLDIYDSNTIYGKRKESNAQVAAMYTNAKKGLSEVDPFAGMTAQQKQNALVAVQPYATMVGQLEDFKNKLENGTIKTIPGKNLESPLLKMGLGPKEDQQAYNLMQNLNQRIIYLRSGKQINEQEYARIRDTMAQLGTMTAANVDRINLLLTEFWDALAARGLNRNNLDTYFPGAGKMVNGSSRPSLDSFNK